MKPVRVVRGPMLPLDRADVDTDQIIPQQFLKRIERDGYGEFLFYNWAHRDDGTPDRGLHHQSSRAQTRQSPGRRSQLRVWLVSGARPVGPSGLGIRCRDRPLHRRHLPQQLGQHRAAHRRAA